MTATKTINLEQFREAIGISLTCRTWGNKRQGDMDKVQTDADKSRLRLQKSLIVAPEYDAILSYLGSIRRWVYSQTVPSFILDGFQLTNKEGVYGIINKLRQASGEIPTPEDEPNLPRLVEKLVAVYPAKVREAQSKLNGQFNIADYPAKEALPGMFGLEFNLLTFTVPEGLPEAIRQAEEAKLQKQMQDASEQITNALRESFLKLVAHARERLTPEPDGTPKIFRDSAIGNVSDFIETFSRRNILNDATLAQLVGQAKQVLAGVDAKQIRGSEGFRKTVSEEFQKIETQLSGMVISKPKRVFRFDDEEPSPVAPDSAAKMS